MKTKFAAIIALAIGLIFAINGLFEPFHIPAIRLGGVNLSVLIGYGLIALGSYQIRKIRAPA
jgi:hypothetical protein